MYVSAVLKYKLNVSNLEIHLDYLHVINGLEFLWNSFNNLTHLAMRKVSVCMYKHKQSQKEKWHMGEILFFSTYTKYEKPAPNTSVQFSSVAQSCLTLCDPMNRSTPGLPVHHQLPEFTETHVHRVGDAIQPCHPLSSPSPPAPNPSQHQSLFQWVNSSHEVAKVLEFQL